METEPHDSLSTASNLERGEAVIPSTTGPLHWCVHDIGTSHSCVCPIKNHHDDDGKAVSYKRLM